MKSLIISCIISTVCLISAAQGTRGISLSVVNENKSPLVGATVELVKSGDSSLQKTALTDNSGQAIIDEVKPGTYLARISMVGYELQYSSRFVINDSTNPLILPVIKMNAKASSTLQGVTVVSRKPFIQKLSDRIVVNVESSIISAGSSALDVLERSPGVAIDQNDVIALRGKQGVIIMVDGKPSPMSASDLANYLRGLPSGAIDRIEIITNPSAKYDASGNSGIIDIRMKKDLRFGSNGTFTAGFGQGIFPKANVGTTLNYRNKKINVFGNYNFGSRKILNHLFLNRNFFENKSFTGSDDKDNYAVLPFITNNARVGADFFPNQKTIAGFVVSSNFLDGTWTTDNHVKEYDYNHDPVSTFHAAGNSKEHNLNIVGNINFRHRFDSTGREITADLDYGEFGSATLSTMLTKYQSLTGGTANPDYRINGDQHGKILLRAGKIDYVNPLAYGAKFEAGFKTSFVSSDNDQLFLNLSTGTPQVDSGKTNHFYYNENNVAAYANFSKEYKNFSMQFGLRGENTSVKTRQIKNNVTSENNYLQLFPSAFFNYKVNADKTVGLSVSRRIDRPNYQQLNPFLFLIDVTTYGTGAPDLKPQLTWSYELSLTQKRVNFSLGYSHTTDVQNTAIMRYRDAFPNDTTKAGNVTVQIPVNLSTSDYFGLTISAPVRVNSWWNLISNTNIFYNHFNAKLAGTTLNNGSPTANLRVDNSFTFRKGWVAELNGNYSSGGRRGYGVSDPTWGISAGVQKSVLKNKGTLKFNMTDFFRTNLPRAVVTYDNYIEHWHAIRDIRVANLSFNYRFGNNKVAAARKRQAASQEEINRAGGQ
jgi:iron complex outermembrane recepter protein